MARLPHQPPAGKLMYRVILQQNMERVTLGGAPVLIRFKGEVPLAVLIVHVICMFGGMLFSTRAALEFFSPRPAYSRLILVTVILLSVGGLVLGPVVQKYAFDAYWTGWPFGTDLTDNKTAVAWLAWVLAWWKTAGPGGGAGWWCGGGDAGGVWDSAQCVRERVEVRVVADLATSDHELRATHRDNHTGGAGGLALERKSVQFDV